MPLSACNLINLDQLETITLGMGCFWSPDALFGQLPGVIRTRVGYSGGTTADPTYRQLGDHSETVELDFNPALVKLEDVLELFWNRHNPDNINDYKGRQYTSIVLYRNERQLEVIEQVMRRRKEASGERPQTEITAFRQFYLAEERHQKYYLKRYPDAIARLGAIYPDEEVLRNGTLAARLNGLAKGYTNLSRIVAELSEWPLSTLEREQLVALVRGIRW